MTNEEAIDELSVIYERLSHPDDCESGFYSFRDGDYLKALELAIQALETGEVYMTGEDYNLYMEGYKSGLSDGRKDAERPKGEWKVYDRQGGIPITDMCSNCRYEMRWYKNKYNFCPNCGADMRGKEE